MRKKYSKEKKHRDGEIPVGSFSDIAFLLIIYFLVATSLVKLKGITADLPTGEKATQQQSSKTPIVNLRGGQTFFNDKPVTTAELEARLQVLNLAEADGNAKVIMLESTRDTPYQSYYQAMAVISEQGGVIAIVDEGDK
ncbi:MAG: biopolymer transporter ExbD [Verrucomicrobia bacterium]|jgi:biopolymer transport protein ExbD|nr:biopolymer transporter ExbD [Verrucomicrobiota bacterium]MBT7068595.1 biopolymer transporter ExbD [Verrucomicrobiota bacterium]MBT7698741.1 biopolymer transporter ExbD [Verrucomicrobiota bacterium]